MGYGVIDTEFALAWAKGFALVFSRPVVEHTGEAVRVGFGSR
jgi:hypothetical protein